MKLRSGSSVALALAALVLVVLIEHLLTPAPASAPSSAPSVPDAFPVKIVVAGAFDSFVRPADVEPGTTESLHGTIQGSGNGWLLVGGMGQGSERSSIQSMAWTRKLASVGEGERALVNMQSTSAHVDLIATRASPPKMEACHVTLVQASIVNIGNVRHLNPSGVWQPPHQAEGAPGAYVPVPDFVHNKACKKAFKLIFPAGDILFLRGLSAVPMTVTITHLTGVVCGVFQRCYPMPGSTMRIAGATKSVTGSWSLVYLITFEPWSDADATGVNPN